jgi:hypothetical protein
MVAQTFHRETVEQYQKSICFRCLHQPKIFASTIPCSVMASRASRSASIKLVAPSQNFITLIGSMALVCQ